MKIKLLALLLGMALVIGMVSGCTEKKDEDIDTNAKPVASIRCGPLVADNYTTGQDIWFNASDSTDANGDTLTYSWEFGDGTIDTSLNVTHNYSMAGAYIVNLTANDGTDDSDKVNVTILVEALIVNALPTASFKYNVTEYNDTTSMSTVTFTDMSSDSGGTIVNWTWDLGDGTVLYEQDPGEHIYNLTAIGGDSVDVSLTVRDDDDGIDEVTATIDLATLGETTV